MQEIVCLRITGRLCTKENRASLTRCLLDKLDEARCELILIVACNEEEDDMTERAFSDASCQALDPSLMYRAEEPCVASS